MLNAVRHHGSAIQSGRRGGCLDRQRHEVRPRLERPRAGWARSLN